MRMIIAGSRHIDEETAYNAIYNYFVDKRLPSSIVSGGARGVDWAGEIYAREMDVNLEIFRADWKTHGKAAGPIRNKQMAEFATCLLLIWDGTSRGSASMRHEMKKLGKPVHEIIIKPEPKGIRGYWSDPSGDI